MTHSDWLQTIAELAIGLAGFSALIASMRDREVSTAIENAGRALAVVETTFSTVALCLLPVVLHGLGLGETRAFQAAGGFAFLIAAPMGVRGIRRATAARVLSGRTAGPISMLISLAGVIVSIAAAIACAFGRPAALVPTFYLCLLCGTLTIASMNFISFVIAQQAISMPDDSLDRESTTEPTTDPH